jgi:hypothetical protein
LVADGKSCSFVFIFHSFYHMNVVNMLWNLVFIFFEIH